MSEVRGNTRLQECHVESELENTCPEGVIALRWIKQ